MAASETTPSNTSRATTAADRRRRKLPIWPLALVGLVVAGAYGHWGLKMGWTPPLAVVALGGATLVYAARALWRVVEPLTGAAPSASGEPETRVPHRLRELEQEKQAVLKAIKEIELDYQMKKIADADYREMIERYRTRALRIMGDLSAGDDYRSLIERELKHRMNALQASAKSPGAATAGSSSASCPDCATVNDTDARFCKRCGQKLG